MCDDRLAKPGAGVPVRRASWRRPKSTSPSPTRAPGIRQDPERGAAASPGQTPRIQRRTASRPHRHTQPLSGPMHASAAYAMRAGQSRGSLERARSLSSLRTPAAIRLLRRLSGHPDPVAGALKLTIAFAQNEQRVRRRWRSCSLGEAAITLASTTRPRTTASGQRQPRECRRPCAPRGQSRSSDTAPGAPDRRDCHVAKGLARRDTAREEKQSSDSYGRTAEMRRLRRPLPSRPKSPRTAHVA